MTEKILTHPEAVLGRTGDAYMICKEIKRNDFVIYTP